MAKYKPHFLLYQEIAKNENLWDEWDIELYEEYPCNNRIDLCKREGEIIREIGTLNKRIAGRTKKEYKQDNAEIIKIKQKQYREDNKEKIKNYRDQHTEKMRLYQKSYFIKKKSNVIIKSMFIENEDIENEDIDEEQTNILLRQAKELYPDVEEWVLVMSIKAYQNSILPKNAHLNLFQ